MILAHILAAEDEGSYSVEDAAPAESDSEADEDEDPFESAANLRYLRLGTNVLYLRASLLMSYRRNRQGFVRIRDGVQRLWKRRRGGRPRRLRPSGTRTRSLVVVKTAGRVWSRSVSDVETWR